MFEEERISIGGVAKEIGKTLLVIAIVLVGLMCFAAMVAAPVHADEISFATVDDEPSFASIAPIDVEPQSFATVASEDCKCDGKCECAKSGRKCECILGVNLTHAPDGTPYVASVMYYREDCLHCPAGKKFFGDRNLAVHFVFDPVGVVPRLEFNGKTCEGYNPAKWEEILGIAKPAASVQSAAPVAVQRFVSGSSTVSSCSSCARGSLKRR